ncbi:MAG: ATP-binding protein [Chloroflexota bacterium]|nr:ATP-binding protein [Chloroflexota bacterium]
MNRFANITRPVPLETYRFLNWALRWLRWATLAVLLLLTVVRPGPSRGGVPNWALILIFIGYNLLVGLLQRWRPNLRSFAWVAFTDLLVAALLYLVSTEPGGPLFVLFFLAVDSAAASLTLRDTLLYTAVVAIVAAVIESMLPLWSSTPRDVRQLVARLVMLGLVGAGMAIVTRRLTLEHDAARQVRAEAERLATLDQVRADFIATVSHELLTPLTAARAGLGMLETSALERLQPSEAELLRNVRHNTEYLGVMIDDLLAFNQIEAGVLRLDRKPFDLRIVIGDATATVATLLAEKRQTLEVDVPTPLLCEGDSRRLQQVVVNVLANAHRYTPEGTRIVISGAATASEIHLMIRDNGPGIPPGELEAIFRRFYRGAPPGVTAFVRSGLGLAIARGIVELHEGRMWAESDPEGGAVFHILLPCPVKGAE